MNLHEYPRPANDTGIGIHWTVGYATSVGMSRIREFWIPEMKSMGVKWVKIFNHDGALDFCDLLLAEGFMPVVRIYRPSPNPGRLGVKELVHLDAMLRAGVRYFEFNNEPDVDAEWKGGRVPVNGLDLTVENVIANMEVILERGGMPGVPALANGSRWDLVGKVVAAGRKDLFDGPVWQAIHNYARNRPLDYPYDIGNQEGAAFTERFYRALASESWGEDAWRGRTLNEVNRLRFDRRSPGATTADDHACWLAYEYFDALNRKHLGRSLPILSTECGHLTGEDVDPRYAATTPDLHMAQTLEACRIMMGTSQRFKHAPDYYFCSAFWLLANEELGSTSTWWESHAWYSTRWPGGTLPAVRALQAEPKAARLGVTAAALPGVTLRGTVAHAGERAVLLVEQNDLVLVRTLLDAGGRFEVADLAPGPYTLRVEGSALAQPVQLTAGQREVLVNLDLGEPVEVISRSVVEGTVRGGAGAVVMLVRKADGEEWVTMAKDDGVYRFVDLPPGAYSVRVYPGGALVENIALDGRNRIEVSLAVAGWGYTIGVADDTQKVGAIVVTTPGHKGLRVQAHSADTSSEPVQTGTAPEYGDFACLLAPLDVGLYIVTVDDVADIDGKPTQLEARVQVDKKLIPLVEFVYAAQVEPTPAYEAAIGGRVLGVVRHGQPVRLILLDSQANRRECLADDEGRFAFEALGEGRYAVAIAGFEAQTTHSDIALDGRNRVEVDLTLPVVPTRPEALPAGASVITGTVPEAGGLVARLVDAVGNEQRNPVGSDGRFRFERLPAGLYAVYVEGGYAQTGLDLDGSNGVEIFFAPVISVWETSVTNAGSMPGFSAVRVEVEGMANQAVRLWQGDEVGYTASTGSQPDQDSCAVEFKPLGPGFYMIEPEGLGVWTSVELTGLEAMWVSFRRKSEAVSPNIVQPLALASKTQSAGVPPVPAVDTYLFLAALPASVDDLAALLDFVAKHRPGFGCDVEAASQARRVLLLDDGSEQARAVELALIMRNVPVERLGAEWRARLQE